MSCVTFMHKDFLCVHYYNHYTTRWHFNLNHYHAHTSHDWADWQLIHWYSVIQWSISVSFLQLLHFQLNIQPISLRCRLNTQWVKWSVTYFTVTVPSLSQGLGWGCSILINGFRHPILPVGVNTSCWRRWNVMIWAYRLTAVFSFPLRVCLSHRWVHVLCAITVLEARFVNVAERGPVDLSTIPLSRFRLVRLAAEASCYAMPGVCTLINWQI